MNPGNEHGRTDTDELRRLINGYQLSQAIHAVVALGIPDVLADGTRTSAQLAEATDAHEGSLYRVLRALAAAGLLEELPQRTFRLTAIGARLRADSERSLAAWAGFVGRPSHWQAWSNLLHSVRTGETAFEHTYGTDVWQYRRDHPEEGAIFDAAMIAQTRSIDRALLEAYDFGRFRVVVDVGGGRGGLLASILQQHPAIRGVLFDQPHVVTGAREFLQAEGLDGRCEIAGGDFFEAVPPGGDVYVLKWIIHDWLDPQATKILQVCRQVLGSSQRIVVIERIVGPPNEDLDTKTSDLQMLVNAGGRERTLHEFEELFAAAGLSVAGVTRTASGMSLIEAVA